MSDYLIPGTEPDADCTICNGADGYCPQCCAPLTEDQWAQRQAVIEPAAIENDEALF